MSAGLRDAHAGSSETRTLRPVDECHRESALRIRRLIQSAQSTPSLVYGALAGVRPSDRDAWVDIVLGLDGIPDDGPDLPRGCTPYHPCSVDALLSVVEQVRASPSDVFVDIGSGLGRAAILFHLLTGADAIGLEVQSELVAAARRLTKRLDVRRVSVLHGDAAKLVGLIRVGTVFFLYCPFSGDRLDTVLAGLEPIARARMIRVCCVHLPPLPSKWLALTPQRRADLAIYQSTIHDA